MPTYQLSLHFAPGDRVLFHDREAEYDRVWPGTVMTKRRGSGTYRVKLDAGLTWTCLERDLRPLAPDEGEYL